MFWSVVLNLLFLVIGMFLLIKGADLFVDGSSSLAKTLRIPTVIIGLTIVAMGTSAPEASVSINAALAGNNDIALSNVVGSNIFNGMVVVGVCAFLQKFKVNEDISKPSFFGLQMTFTTSSSLKTNSYKSAILAHKLGIDMNWLPFALNADSIIFLWIVWVETS